MKLAPIILFVYNRPQHTLATLEALSKNVLADQSALYIFCDGPKPNSTAEQLQDIEAARKVVHQRKWCGEVHIAARENNIGLAKSITGGITKVIGDHGRVIVLEDDIVTSPYFLSYMNTALELYKDEESVFGISGFKYDSDQINDQTFFLPIACSWGWSTWKRAWDKIELDENKLIDYVMNNKLEKQFDFGGYPFYDILTSQAERKVDSWAIKFYGTLFMYQGLFLFPNQSLVQNIGFDESGTHCHEEDFFSHVVFANDFSSIDKIEVGLIPWIVKSVESKFSAVYIPGGNILQRTKSLLTRLKNYVSKTKK